MNEDKITEIEQRRTLAEENRKPQPAWTASKADIAPNGKTAFRIITIEREIACGAAVICKKLSDILGWTLWDQLLAQELADSIRRNTGSTKSQTHRADDRFCRLAKVFWRGSYERIAPLDSCPFVDAAHMVAIMRRVSDRIAREGNAVVVGRGAPGFFQNRHDTFHIFLYASREERIRRLIANGKSESEVDIVEAVDRERAAFVKQYFGAHWPTRSFYDLMINTAIGEDNVISTILHAMLRVGGGRRSMRQAS
jgi:Cytidylate kinase-like family